MFICSPGQQLKNLSFAHKFNNLLFWCPGTIFAQLRCRFRRVNCTFFFIFLAPYFFYQNRNVVLVVVVFSLRAALSLFEWLWFSLLRSSSVKLPCLFYYPLKTMGLELSGCPWGLGQRTTATKSRKNGAGGSWAGNRKSAWEIVLQDFPNI